MRLKAAILGRFPEKVVRSAAYEPNGADQGLWPSDYDNQHAPVETVAGRTVRRTDFTRDLQTLKFTVQEAGLYSPANELWLSFGYLDLGDGDVTVVYNGIGGNQLSTPDLPRTNSGQWKTATFTLTDALLKGGNARPVHGAHHFRFQALRTTTDLCLSSVRLTEVARPYAAYEQLVAAYQSLAREHRDDWSGPLYEFHAALVLIENLGRATEGFEIVEDLLATHPTSEAATQIRLYRSLGRL
jgi:hypothetical protein